MSSAAEPAPWEARSWDELQSALSSPAGRLTLLPRVQFQVAFLVAHAGEFQSASTAGLPLLAESLGSTKPLAEALWFRERLEPRHSESARGLPWVRDVHDAILHRFGVLKSWRGSPAFEAWSWRRWLATPNFPEPSEPALLAAISGHWALMARLDWSGLDADGNTPNRARLRKLAADRLMGAVERFLALDRTDADAISAVAALAGLECLAGVGPGLWDDPVLRGPLARIGSAIRW